MTPNLWVCLFFWLYHGHTLANCQQYSRKENLWFQQNQEPSESQCPEGWTCVAAQNCHGTIRPWYFPKSRCGKYMTLVCCGPVAYTSDSSFVAESASRNANAQVYQRPGSKPNYGINGSRLKASFTNHPKLSDPQTNRNLINAKTSKPGKKVSRSEQACKEYSQVKCVRGKNSEVKKCQVLVKNIVGGAPAKRNELPFLVAIGYNKKGNNSPSSVTWACAGNIISDKYVLTAAHCITDAEKNRMVPTTLRVGQTRVTGSARPGEDYSVADILRHPGHRPNERHHDLALLRADRPLRFSDNVRPICLPPAGSAGPLEAPGKVLVAGGWGATNPNGSGGSVQLMKAELTALSLNECRKIYENENMQSALKVLNENVLCASDPKRRTDTCNGDSGGPLVARQPSGTYTLIGITSFGSSPCAGKVPGVYARTAAEIAWIESVVWP